MTLLELFLTGFGRRKITGKIITNFPATLNLHRACLKPIQEHYWKETNAMRGTEMKTGSSKFRETHIAERSLNKLHAAKVIVMSCFSFHIQNSRSIFEHVEFILNNYIYL